MRGGLSRGTDPAALMEGLQEAGLVSWRASRVVLAQALSNRLGKPLAVIPSNAPEYLRGLALISCSAPDSNEKKRCDITILASKQSSFDNMSAKGFI